jgi:hypothetical protein
MSTKQGFSFLSSRGKLFNELRTQITAAITLGSNDRPNGRQLVA